MQAKGLIKFFLIALFVVCIYQLMFTIATSIENGKAHDHAIEQMMQVQGTGDMKAIEEDVELYKSYKKYRRDYLTSRAGEEVINLGIYQFTLNECQSKQLNLGLDLKGGLSVVMEVNVADVLVELSYRNNDANFREAIKLAKQDQKNSQDDFLTLFQNRYDELAEANDLAKIFKPLSQFDSRLDWDDTNAEVVDELRDDVEGTIEVAFNTIKTRVDQFGVAQPNITFEKSTGRIIIEMPGIDDKERAKTILTTAAQLEFWHAYKNSEVFRQLEAVDVALRDMPELTGAEVTPEDTTIAALPDSIADSTGTMIPNPAIAAAEAADTANPESYPLFEVLYPNITQDNLIGEGPVVGTAFVKDTATVNKYFRHPDIRALIDQEVKFLWSAKGHPDDNQVLTLYAIKNVDGGAPLTGDYMESARQDFDPSNGEVLVSMNMDVSGAEIWYRMTSEAASNPDGPGHIAVVLDNRVYTAPVVNNPIAGGSSVIQGSFSITEAQDLAKILNSGKLAAKAEIIQSEEIGPTMGAESVQNGLLSLIIGFVLVFIFMIVYYSTSGIVSDLALLLNVFYIIGAISSLGAALTFPGMAGIVLTIGMAVDANVIIYERIREEITKGKGPRLALTDGYKHSYSAIIDANVTTLITAIILLFFGLGPVKGFAVILVIGIISSLITAVLFTRLVFDYLMSKDKKVNFSTSFTNNAFKNINIDFLGKRKMAYIASAIIIVSGIASYGIQESMENGNGFQLGVDFEGGRRYIVQFDQPVNPNDVSAAFAADDLFGQAPEVKTFGSASKLQITTSYMIDSSGTSADSAIKKILHAGLSGYYANAPDLHDFMSTDSYVESTVKVEASIADDIRKSSIWVSLIAAVCIFLYILLRFRKWQFGLGALAAIAHDILIILSLFTLLKGIMPFSMEINQAIVAALLTIIGYSINDTVVVFDRIREYLNLHPTTGLFKNVNNAINSTLSRTLITSVTTLIVVIILFIFGGESIRGFAFALIVGIAVGTYSSVFIASPITIDLLKGKEDKE